MASRDHDADWTQRVAGSGRALSRGHFAHQEKPHYETGSLGSGEESRKEGNDWETRELSPTSEFGLLKGSADQKTKREERPRHTHVYQKENTMKKQKARSPEAMEMWEMKEERRRETGMETEEAAEAERGLAVAGVWLGGW